MAGVSAVRVSDRHQWSAAGPRMRRTFRKPEGPTGDHDHYSEHEQEKPQRQIQVSSSSATKKKEGGVEPDHQRE